MWKHGVLQMLAFLEIESEWRNFSARRFDKLRTVPPKLWSRPIYGTSPPSDVSAQQGLSCPNQRTRARDPFIPFALPLSFLQKIFIQRAKIQARQHQTRLQQARTALPGRDTNNSSIVCTKKPTSIRRVPTKKETIRPNQVSISRSEIIENLSVSKHVHSNNDPTQRLKTMGIAVTCSMRRKTKQTCPQC
jgi:hypothetical protein